MVLTSARLAGQNIIPLQVLPACLWCEDQQWMHQNLLAVHPWRELEEQTPMVRRFWFGVSVLGQREYVLI